MKLRLQCRNTGYGISLFLLWIAAVVSGQQDEIVVSINRFLLRLGPTSAEFTSDERATVLWTVEYQLQVYFEDLYKNSNAIFKEAGITGLSVVPRTDDTRQAYEVLKFLGGAVAFDSSSTEVPSEDEVQDLVRDALTGDELLKVLQTHFKDLETIEFVELSLGDRGFDGFDEVAQEEQNRGGSGAAYVTPPPESPTKPVPYDTYNNGGGDGDSNANGGSNSNGHSNANGDSNSNGATDTKSVPDSLVSSQAQRSPQGNNDMGPDNTTIGLSIGLAFAVTILIVLVAVLFHGRRKRMSFWRERSDEDEFDARALDDGLYKAKSPSSSPRHKAHQLALEEESEPSLRLPRIWGVSPSPRMEEGTCSEMSHEGEDSVQEILTCTSMGVGSIRNVESFEHQKRLVDTLKKEMMASNAEIHPYMQDPHLDNTEPCALSPTDLSAAALENRVPQHSVAAWPTRSESSVSGSMVSGSESGYDSPSGQSPQRTIFGSLNLTSHRKPPSHDISRYPYSNRHGDV